MNRQAVSFSTLFLLGVILNGAGPGSETTYYPVDEYLDSHGHRLTTAQAEARLVNPRYRQSNPSSIPGTKTLSIRDDLWTLTHVDDSAEYYLGSGDSLDTFAVVFTPAAPCIVKEVYVQWYTPGDVIAYGANYSDSAEALSPDGECSDFERGSINFSPIGTPRTTPTLNHIEEYASDWSAQLDIGGEFVVGDSADLSHNPPFVIVLIKQGSTPNPLADATDDQDSLTYTWFGGPWTDGQWGRYSDLIELMMMVKVAYPFGPDSYVQSLTQLPNTYCQTGPFEVYFDVFCSNGFHPDSQDVVSFKWAINGQNAQLGDLLPEAVGADGNGIYRAEINGEFSLNDQIEYWATWQAEIDGETPHLSFEIKQPANPYADILLIADNAHETQLDANLYGQTLSNMGLVYEFWDTRTERGIDSSVVNFGWRNIIMFGWGNKTLPVQTPRSIWYRPNPRYDLFLDSGKRLALIDQDWFYGHGQPEEPVFGPGNFAYDYFGLTGAVNDPVSGADTLFTGAGVTPVDSAFVTNPYRLTHGVYGTDNWGDYLIPGTATPIFTGVNDDNCYGVINTDGNFHTVFLPFMADAAVDTLPDGTVVSPQFTQLLHGIINWFDVAGATTPEQIQPKEFSLSPNFPNPFNPTTRINFTVPASGKVSIAIYNLLGQKVNQLVNSAFQSGSYSVVWNGRDGNGQQLATGIYLYRMEAVEFSQTRKLVLLK